MTTRTKFLGLFEWQLAPGYWYIFFNLIIYNLLYFIQLLTSNFFGIIKVKT